ncbi:hypothetical protein IWQ62_003811 [Dispira parvispora]|uniref:Uncharacterized protein n=1 Tax=Dispira parvispora TaxID=1520584 RepID=A0A9W8ATI1_9FUNG|nr:hypothetical protein IWQ62_003811 [Dispira parvispora]
MRIASITVLSIVATSLLGSVWAISDLYSLEGIEILGEAISEEYTPQWLDGDISDDKLDHLLEVARTGESFSRNEIAAAAKVFLLEKAYLKNSIIEPDVLEGIKGETEEARSCRYFVKTKVVVHYRYPGWEHDSYTIYSYIKIREIKVLKDLNFFRSNSYTDKVFFKLHNNNAVEAQAADFISEL